MALPKSRKPNRRLPAYPEGDAGGKLTKLIRAYPLLQETRTATGENLVDYTEMMIGAWGHQMTDAQREKLKNGKTLMTIAYQIDPDGAKVQKLLKSMDGRIDQFIDKMTAAIDAAEWPGNSSSFPGTGNVGQLSNDAIKYLQCRRCQRLCDRSLEGGGA